MPLTVLEEKLLRLALDKAAPKGESDAAALKLIASLRTRQIDGYDHNVKSAFGGKNNYSYDTPPNPPGFQPDDWPGSIIMPIGKYQNKRLAEIDPSYFSWALRTWDRAERGELMDAMEWLLADLKARNRRRK